jgi:hypothetical protein
MSTISARELRRQTHSGTDEDQYNGNDGRRENKYNYSNMRL